MSITVTARKWKLGWELILDEHNATQVRTLDQAEAQVRDYLDTIDPDVDHTGWEIDVVPDLGHLAGEIAAARRATADAAAAQQSAAAQTRTVVHAMRAAGLSLTDCAAVLGVSRGRVSQLG